VIEKPPAQVIVIGAGIAGLTAAHLLAAAGMRVKVLEASGRVGGRMNTGRLHGFPLDRGAQFLSTEYSLLLSLAREVGLDETLCATSQWNAIVRRGKIRRLCGAGPLSALTSGLFGPFSWMKLGWQLWRHRTALATLPLNDYSQWSGFDRETIAKWADRTLGSSILEYLIEPILHGFYFQEPEESSLALGLMLLAFGSRRGRTMALAGGLGSLPEAIAARLDVGLHSPVGSIHCGPSSVFLQSEAGQFEAEHVILAVPAPEARLLFLSGGEPANRLMAVPYSATINISVVTEGGFHLPSSLRDVYGLLVPRLERRHIAAICIEANKNRVARQDGQLLSLLLCHTSAKAMMELPDDEIASAALVDAERFLPGLAAQSIATQLNRWRHAEPFSQVGRARDIAKYRDPESTKGRRVWLSGDYMSMPFTEGAAESGKWAAEAILKRAAGISSTERAFFAV
jgi:oxygen-dependent protoporphyrinogen oxidase